MADIHLCVYYGPLNADDDADEWPNGTPPSDRRGESEVSLLAG